MALNAVINQNVASIRFSALIVGASPAIVQPQVLQPGFPYQSGVLNMIGVKVVGGQNQYVLYDNSDNTQTFYGVTFDNWLNSNNFALSQTPITFVGNTSIALGNAGQTYVQNITGTTNSSTTITNVSINTAGIALGTVLSGEGIVPGTTVTATPSATSLTISVATLTSVAGVAIAATTSGIIKGNIPGSNDVNPYLPTSVVTGITNTATLVIGALVSGTGIPAQSTILEILSPSAILIAGNVTSTQTSLTITSYLTPASQMLVDIATTQNATTQFRYNYLIGAQGGQVDIDALIAANSAQLLTLPNGSLGIQVVTFNFMGAA